MAGDLLNSFTAGPDESGRFGDFGGRFVSETLMPLILELEKEYEKIEKAYYDLFENWKDHAREEDGLYIVTVPGEFKLTSAVSSIISFTEPEKTFFFYQLNVDGVHISMRSQHSQIHLGELVKMVSKEFTKAHGGGHRPAAGAFCLEKDLSDFIQRIKDGIQTFSAS